MSNIKTTCFIVGAGPSGLALACLLSYYDISFIIIDKKEGLTQTSNAAVVNSKTLELLQTLGISDKLINQGNKNQAFLLSLGHSIVNKNNFNHIRSPYNFLLGLPQSFTEKALHEFMALLHKSDLG